MSAGIVRSVRPPCRQRVPMIGVNPTSVDSGVALRSEMFWQLFLPVFAQVVTLPSDSMHDATPPLRDGEYTPPLSLHSRFMSPTFCVHLLTVWASADGATPSTATSAIRSDATKK